MLQHICSLLDWAYLNLEGASTSQCYKCWMKVTLQWLPAVCLAGYQVHAPFWGVCNQYSRIWLCMSLTALCVFGQWQYLFIWASLLCPEAGEGTVKMKGRWEILGSVSWPLWLPWKLLLCCHYTRFTVRQANHLLVSILTVDTYVMDMRFSGSIETN